MATVKGKKVKSQNYDPIKDQINRINQIFNRLETEVETVLKRLIKQGEKSGKELKQNFDEVLKKVKKTDLYAKAQERTGDLEREIRKLADDVVTKVSSLEISPNGFNAKKLLKEGRRSLDTFVETLEKSEMLSKAKSKAENTKNGLLSILSIPTQHEVGKLEKRIIGLEKKIHTLSGHKAA